MSPGAALSTAPQWHGETDKLVVRQTATATAPPGSRPWSAWPRKVVHSWGAINRLMCDPRLDASTRVLIACGHLTGSKTPKLIAESTGLSEQEVKRTISRLSAPTPKRGPLLDDHLGLILDPVPVGITDRVRCLKVPPKWFPDISIWGKTFDPLFADRLAYLRDLANPTAVDFWRFFYANVKKAKAAQSRLLEYESPVREYLVLLALQRVYLARKEEQPESVNWSVPNQGLSALVRRLKVAEFEAVDEGRNVSSQLRAALPQAGRTILACSSSQG